jgi:hypothetical protein
LKGGLIAVTCCVAAFVIAGGCVLGFYLEENARGAAAWKKVRTEIEAQGTSLDPQSYIPALPPSEQNFGALPIFQVEPDLKSEQGHAMIAQALNTAMEPVYAHLASSNLPAKEKSDSIPFLGKWNETKPDLALIRARLADLCRQAHPNTPPAPDADALQLFSSLCPALADLRAANRTRPLCVFPRDDDVKPGDFSFGPTTALVRLAKVLQYEERLAFEEKKPQLVLDDMAVSRKAIQGLQKAPFLVTGLVAVALEEWQVGVLQQGLADHDWNDAQLVQLDTELGEFDVLASAHYWLSSETVDFTNSIYAYYEKHLWEGSNDLQITSAAGPTLWSRLIFCAKPRGWFDLDRATYNRFELLDTLSLIDPKRRLVHADRFDAVGDSIAGQKTWVISKQLFTGSVRPFMDSVKNFAMAQIHLDEARIACRLERYRLAHGVYPASLAALVPVYGAQLPHDVMDGEPYHYRLRSDGSYLLYSVAWNQVDDHGDSAVTPPQLPRDALDWVWFSRHEPTAK